jgi:hypothetical protein
MSASFGRYGPTHKLLGALTERISRKPLTAYAARHGFHAPDSVFARERGATFAESSAAASRSTSPASDPRVTTAASRWSKCRATRACA